MEKLHKEPDVTRQDYYAFVNELKLFHQNRGTPFRDIPKINGREIDLQKFYDVVTSLGGLQKVIDHQKWNMVSDELRLPKACINSALSLRQIYIRFLGHYEKIHFMGEEPENDKSQSSESHSKRLQLTLFHQVPMVYNYAQHEVSDFVRSTCGMNQVFVTATDYDKLCMSLLSALPNEQELALNVCTILSNEGNYMLHLEQAPKLLDLLIAQTGLWPPDDAPLKRLYLESWRSIKGRNMYRFWRTTLDLQNAQLMQLLGIDIGDHDPDYSLMNLENDLGSLSPEGQRVLRVALILHNLSFEKNNVPVLVSNSNFLRFILLCVHSAWGNLSQTAYDTLANLACELKLSIEKDIFSRIMFQTVMEGILSGDRFMNIRSMDILSQLCACEPNEDIIPSRLDVEVYYRMVSFLTVHDILLLFYTLEALYALSDLGRYACEKIVCVHRSIGALVSLLTLEPSQYGPSGQIKMKIIETLVPVETECEQETPVLLTSEPSSTSVPLTMACDSDVDSETFVCNWLKTTYEAATGSMISRNEIYAEYVNFCSKAGRKGVVNANVFANCVKNVFPACGLKKTESGSGVITFHHDGLCKKKLTPTQSAPSSVKSPSTVCKVPIPTTPVPSKAGQKQSHSPILKAQLSAPPRSGVSSPPLVSKRPSTKSPPSSPPATVPVTSGSSTLIKSLLANKVQQRNLQRQIVPQNVPKMLIYSSDKVTTIGSTSTVMRCLRPSINSQITRTPFQTRFIQTNKGRVITQKVMKTNLLPKIQHIASKPANVSPTSRLNGVQREAELEVQMQDEEKKCEEALSIVQNHLSSDSLIDGSDSILSDGESLQSLKDSSVSSDSERNFVFSPLNDNAVNYRWSESPTSSNLLIVRSMPCMDGLPSSRDQNGSSVTFVNNSMGTGLSLVPQQLIPPKIVATSTNILKSVLGELEHTSDDLTKQQLQKEKICKRAPLLNGLLDKGRMPIPTEIESCSLVQNGSNQNEIDSDDKYFVQSNLYSTITPVSTLNSIIPTTLNSIILPTSTLSSVNVPTSSLSTAIIPALSLNSTFIPTSSSLLNSTLSLSTLTASTTSGSTLNSAIASTLTMNSPLTSVSSVNNTILTTAALNTSSTLSSILSTALPSSPSPPPSTTSVIPASSFHPNGDNLMQICAGQTTLSGTIEVQPDQKGVVRLHIESPENSNQGSDLSSISDIARTLECASKAISRTNAECNSQVPFSATCDTTATVTVINTNTSPTLARTGQQIIVVTPALNQPQLHIQSPNIKFRILHSIPKVEDSVDVIGFPRVNINQLRQTPLETPSISSASLKRPSSESPIPYVVSSEGKKPRLDTKTPLLEATLRLPTPVPCSSVSAKSFHEPNSFLIKASSIENMSTSPKLSSSNAVAVPVQNVDFPNEKETKTFSGLSLAGDHSPHITSSLPPRSTSSTKLEYSCDWKDCGKKFHNPGGVFLHASKCHAPMCSDDMICLWEGCDTMKRRRFSLLTHLQDWHCNERVLHTQALRRKQLSNQGQTSIAPPQMPPPHPGYAPDAALLAIRRHALQYLNPKELSEEKESALTKSIRLTSALILRNLVTHSSLARTYLRRFEPELAYLAMSPVESARTIAQCLSHLATPHD